MLDANLKAQIAPLFDRMPHDVVLTARLDNSDSAAEMREFLSEVNLTSERLTLVESAQPAKRMPSFSVARVNQEARVEFACIPSGHEFTSLIFGDLACGRSRSQIRSSHH